MATSQFLNLDTDGTLSTNSDTVVPSEKAIKTYVDSKTVSADGTTIENNANVLSAIGVKDQNTGNADKFWTGTKDAYKNVATKDSNTTYRTTDEAEPESVRRIGEIVTSLLPLFDAGLHLLDGAVLSGVGVYSTFVSYVAGLATNYPNLFTTEANWQSSVTTYGVCGKFVYDSGANTVRLPKITGIIEGTIDVTALGDLVEAGLPNITGSLHGIRRMDTMHDASLMSKALHWQYGNYPQKTNTSSVTGNMDFDPVLDASVENPIYKNNFNKVQPQTIKGFYYIVVATSTKTEIESDIDQIASDLNLKAGTDLSNLTNAGKIVSANLCMPSNAYDNLTLGAAGSTYTAPANGYFVIGKRANANGQFLNIRLLDENLNDITTYWSDCGGSIGNLILGHFIPCQKGWKVAIDYTAGGVVTAFRFIYAEGSKSEKV